LTILRFTTVFLGVGFRFTVALAVTLGLVVALAVTLGAALTVVFALGFGVGLVVAAIAPDVPKSIATVMDSVRSGRFIRVPI
jgi:hypothetical protein